MANLIGSDTRYPSGALVSVSVYVPSFNWTECGALPEVQTIGLMSYPSKSVPSMRNSAPGSSADPPTSTLENCTLVLLGLSTMVTWLPSEDVPPMMFPLLRIFTVPSTVTWNTMSDAGSYPSGTSLSCSV